MHLIVVKIPKNKRANPPILGHSLRLVKINALFHKVHYTHTGCLGKYAAERSQKHLI